MIDSPRAAPNARVMSPFRLAVVLLSMLPALCGAATFRYASAFEPGSMDPHAVATVYNTRVLSQIYDSLVGRDENFELEPQLALSWTAVPTGWRFKLRPGVKFHDGAPFTADDVVFSVERALAPSSAVKSALPNVTGARKIDALTVDIATNGPTPVLPMALTNMRIANKAWMDKHGAAKPQNFSAKEDTFVSRNANGTGPYMLKSWVPDSKTILVANPSYWGKRGNVTEAQYLVLGSPATRIAGLVSREIDLVIDPATQDIERLKATPHVKIVTGLSRATQFLGFDQARDKLLYADAGPKNPFKDRRVRLAVRYGIDLNAMQEKVMRGLALSGSALYTPAVAGYDKRFDKFSPYDPAKARELLKEAGYPNGFGVTLHCSNAPPTDGICQAVTGMLARIGIRVTYAPLPFNSLVPKIMTKDVSFYALGWTPSTDAEGVLVPIAHSPNAPGNGEYNAGAYSNAKVDALVDKARVELDPAKRLSMLVEAMVLVDEDVGFIPIHYRRVFWAVGEKVQIKPRPNDQVELRFVNVRE
ncbi:Heme-binding protein A [Usitatibacter rugosus]|uniref:Heme-binding protein A n=2 Tax=Usitatibacter rugosus TaxID=2732067 RepID=A0A6M4GVS8_9PROT|nr:Heme-binding protein A [Usitatibacter rugosus]